MTDQAHTPPPGNGDQATTVRCPSCGSDVDLAHHEPWAIHGSGQRTAKPVVIRCPYCEYEITLAE